MDAMLSAQADEKGVYEAGAEGFDLSEEPVVEDRDKMTDNTPETRQEVGIPLPIPIPPLYNIVTHPHTHLILYLIIFLSLLISE
jgi:hypothetical protein